VHRCSFGHTNVAYPDKGPNRAAFLLGRDNKQAGLFIAHDVMGFSVSPALRWAIPDVGPPTRQVAGLAIASPCMTANLSA